MAKKKKFTPRREKFIEEYIAKGNAAEAARNAGYSVKTADRIGHALLRNIEIADEIARRRAELRKTSITPERIIREYLQLLNVSMKDISTWGPGGVKPHPSDMLTEDQAAAISEIAETQSGIKVKLHDKKGILDSLARIAGMFVEKVEHSGKLEYEIVLPEEMELEGEEEPE
jgi:phage terminase small subunit